MDVKRANQILMQMGGERCRVSHLLKNNFCTKEEIAQMVKENYLIKTKDDYVQKTKKGKELW